MYRTRHRRDEEAYAGLGQPYFAAESQKQQNARVGNGVAKILCAEVYLIEPSVPFPL